MTGFDLVVFAVDCFVSKTVGELYTCDLYDSLYLELVRKNFVCVIRPEVTQCGLVVAFSSQSRIRGKALSN